MDEENRFAIELQDQKITQHGQKENSTKTEGVWSLVSALSDSDYSVRRNAAEALLHQNRCPEHFGILVEAICSNDPIVAEIAVYALESYGEDAVDALISKLDSCNCLVQLTIVAALEHIGSQKAVAPLLQILSSTTFATLRYTIIQTLGRLRDPAAIDPIQLFVDDSDHHVAKRARIALEKLRSVGLEIRGRDAW